MVHFVREPGGGKVSDERRYYISNLPKRMDLFAEAVELILKIENKAYWRLDVVFGEDQTRARTKYAGASLSALRKMVFNIVRKEPGKKGLTRKMRSAAARPDSLTTLLG